VLLGQAVSKMSSLHSARLTWAISDGGSGMAIAGLAFVAPNREYSYVPREGEAIQIGTTTYLRDAGAASWTVEPNSPNYTWPEGAFDEFGQGVGAIDLGEGSVLGVSCTKVAFYSPQFGGIYEVWIGNQDHLIHEYLIAAPSHYMVSLFHDFDGPIRIEPPVSPPNPSGIG
jgi:hypothetical protein